MRSTTLFLLLIGASLLSAQDEQIYRRVDEKATFPYDRQQCESYVDACAEAALQAYLKSAIQPDSTMGDGEVRVQFIIEKDGKITEPKITTSLNPAADAEAIRLVNSMNDMSQPWRAAWHENGFVRSYGTVKIQFKTPRKPPKTGSLANLNSRNIPPPPPPPPYPPVPPNKGALSEKGSLVHKVVDEMPMFPNAGKQCEKSYDSYRERKSCADKGMLEYVYGKVRYHPEDRENGIEGMAIVSFVIEADGSISSPEIVRNPGGFTGQQALKVILQMIDEDIRWIPGKMNGEFVATRFNLPIKFKLP